MESYEAACELAEKAATDAEKAARRLVSAARSLARAAKEGNPAKLQQGVGMVATAASEASSTADAARAAWPHSDDTISDFLDRGYQDELIHRGELEGVRLSPLDDRLAAFPVVVQIMARARVLRLDTARLGALRPSFVIGRIKAQQKKPSTKPETFIEVLYRAYVRLVGDEIGRGVTMAEIHALLTILPEAKRSYGKAEFARDVFLLDSSSVRTTRSGARVTFPAATGTKGGRAAFVVVPPDGMPKHYFGLRFEVAR